MRSRIERFLASLVVVYFAAGVHTSSGAKPWNDATSPFQGKIAITADQSIPDWPKLVKAPAGAPNIVLILLDDIGFGDTSTFGGLARTPELDRLAARGLRFNNFHTAPRCSPTRAALLTGRNPHRVGFGDVSDFAVGYPGYDSVWKDSAASIAEVLRQHGYSTSAFGKWHNTPDWEITLTGPFERWPTGRGFEYFYGLMYGSDNQWEPTGLFRNTLPADAPSTPEQGYHFTTDITNEAIRWVAQHQARAAEKPYLLYYAPGAVHAPHHAPREWIDQYRGKFDRGWDELRAEILERQKRLGIIPMDTLSTPRPKEIPAWRSLSTDQQKINARQMEVYAGFVSHTDHEVGRLLSAVASSPTGDNTIVIYVVGDNGADGGTPDGVVMGATSLAEQLGALDRLGGPEIPYNSYSRGWAWAGNTPFQYWKEIASHLGSLRNPMVVSWPAKIKKRGELRDQFTYVTDVAATLYDVVGIETPAQVNGIEQQSLDGVSFANTFESSEARSAHRTQYFELLGHRAIYHDGWMASARHQREESSTESIAYANDRWELYHVAEDFSQARDLAKQQPDKLRELRVLFDEEAKRNDVFPLGAVLNSKVKIRGAGKPSPTQGKWQFIYPPSEARIPIAEVPPLDVSHRMSAEIVVPEGSVRGVLAAFGSRVDGFAWYVADNRVVYEIVTSGHHKRVVSTRSLPQGKVRLAYELRRASSAGLSPSVVRLYINDEMVGNEEVVVAGFRPTRGLYIGHSAGVTITDSEASPFKFTGTIQQIKVEMLDSL